jgi:hypothetical protein
VPVRQVELKEFADEFLLNVPEGGVRINLKFEAEAELARLLLADYF